jgi:hypothetical protein
MTRKRHKPIKLVGCPACGAQVQPADSLQCKFRYRGLPSVHYRLCRSHIAAMVSGSKEDSERFGVAIHEVIFAHIELALAEH